MDGREKYSTTFSSPKKILEIISGLHTDDRIISDESFCIGKLSRELVIEISPIGNNHDSGTRKMRTLHEDAREIEHREALPTTCRSEICSSLSISRWSHTQLDTLEELVRGIILRITTDDLGIILRSIRKVDKVPYHIEESLLVKESPHHRKK